MELYCANKILRQGCSVIGVQVAGALRLVIPCEVNCGCEFIISMGLNAKEPLHATAPPVFVK